MKPETLINLQIKVFKNEPELGVSVGLRIKPSRAGDSGVLGSVEHPDGQALGTVLCWGVWSTRMARGWGLTLVCNICPSLWCQSSHSS